MMDHTFDLADIAEMLPPFALWTEGCENHDDVVTRPPDYIHMSLLDAYSHHDGSKMTDRDAVRIAKQSPFVLAWMLAYDVPCTPHTIMSLCHMFTDLQNIANRRWQSAVIYYKGWIEELQRVMRHACFVYYTWRKALPVKLRRRAPRAGERNLNWTTKRVCCTPDFLEG